MAIPILRLLAKEKPAHFDLSKYQPPPCLRLASYFPTTQSPDLSFLPDESDMTLVRNIPMDVCNLGVPMPPERPEADNYDRMFSNSILAGVVPVLPAPPVMQKKSCSAQQSGFSTFDGEDKTDEYYSESTDDRPRPTYSVANELVNGGRRFNIPCLMPGCDGRATFIGWEGLRDHLSKDHHISTSKIGNHVDKCLWPGYQTSRRIQDCELRRNGEVRRCEHMRKICILLEIRFECRRLGCDATRSRLEDLRTHWRDDHGDLEDLEYDEGYADGRPVSPSL